MGLSSAGDGGYGARFVRTEPPWPIVVLWATPRTVSTAFERMMIERGDHIVFDEPYSTYYYFGADAPSSRFDSVLPDSEPAQITAKLTEAATRSRVFVKDMAYQAGPLLEPGFLGRFVNTFIIREPTSALASFARRWPDLTEEEAGYSRLLQAYEIASSLGAPPPVIDSDDLRADPVGIVRAWCDAVDLAFMESALSWPPGMQPQWSLWADWYDGVAASTGFLPPDTQPPSVDDARLNRLADRCRPIYERLFEVRLRA